MALKDILDGIDLIAARLRVWMRGTTGLVLTLQGVYAMGGFDKIVPPDSRWAKWVAFGGILVAYYTQRRGEPAALLAVKKEEAAAAIPVKP